MNQRKKVIEYTPDALAKVVHELMAGWKVHQMRQQQMMRYIEVHLRELGCLLVELRFPALIFLHGARAHKN